ncbi:MAG TPA: stage II sporulation protein M [Candidatus Nanoarchaeia archaeon]|nr:stage II sporulation protein M [Candidatus Nanoarchaeia archaeon]
MNLEKYKRDAIFYLKDSKRYIYSAALIFFFFVLLGIVFSSKLGFIDEIIRKLVSNVSSLKGLQVGEFIFINNVTAAFAGLVGGILFGIFPLFNIMSNGLVVGYVFSRVAREVGIFEIWKILPHGIFELPAIFISLGLGIRLGSFVFAHRPLKTLRERIYYSALVFVLIVIPLLLLAACIEGMLIDIFE